jgi:hypothetical protein
MAFKLIFLEPAIIDLENAFQYYEGKVNGLGIEFENEVVEAVKLIRRNPLLFPIKFANVHEALINRFPYVLTYEVVEKHILVLAVFNTHQNPKKKTNPRKTKR